MSGRPPRIGVELRGVCGGVLCDESAGKKCILIDTMIEAGDPVQLAPIRTTNAGQGFQGFWRPTA